MDVGEGENMEEVVAWGILPGVVERFGLSCERFFREEDAFLQKYQRQS